MPVQMLLWSLSEPKSNDINVLNTTNLIQFRGTQITANLSEADFLRLLNWNYCLYFLARYYYEYVGKNILF